MIQKSKCIDKFMIPGYSSFHEDSFVNSSDDDSNVSYEPTPVREYLE